jgi:hypothetical protein
MQKTSDDQLHDKEAPEAGDGERMGPPEAPHDGAIRGAREELEIAHERDEEGKRAKGGAVQRTPGYEMHLAGKSGANPL